MAELDGIVNKVVHDLLYFSKVGKTIWMSSEKVRSKLTFLDSQVPSKEAAVSFMTRLISKLVLER